MHAARCQSLCDAATTAARHQQLSLTALGRASERAITPKAAIKRMDRLLGNNLLHRERLLVYRALAQTVLRERRQTVLVLDWTAVSPGGHWYALRAAQISQGRTLTVFDAVYPQVAMERSATIAEVLRQLAQVLPAGCTPLLILDAGFRSHWFAAITARGWHWLARIRNNTHCRMHGQSHWQACKTLYVRATRRPQRLGRCALTRGRPQDCTLYLYQRQRKGRHAYRNGKRC
ncbi:MAG: IS4 family transposase, partial [Pseudomonadota bacterium]